METEDNELTALAGLYKYYDTISGLSPSMPDYLIQSYKDLLAEINKLNEKVDDVLTPQPQTTPLRSTPHTPSGLGYTTTSGNTIYPTSWNPTTNPYKLTRDMGYFIYWLMMNYSTIEEYGYQPINDSIASNLQTHWCKSVIRDGSYNEMDREFLIHIREWLSENWVYKKPDINEHNDIYERLQSLPR